MQNKWLTCSVVAFPVTVAEVAPFPTPWIGWLPLARDPGGRRMALGSRPESGVICCLRAERHRVSLLRVGTRAAPASSVQDMALAALAPPASGQPMPLVRMSAYCYTVLCRG